jgi:pantoate kinase
MAEGCGCTDPVFPNGPGTAVNGTIHLFERALNGVGCAPFLIETLAHEIGHNLGLGDVASNCLGACPRSIMGQPDGQPDIGALECGAVDDLWDVPGEQQGEEPPPGGCLAGPPPEFLRTIDGRRISR